MVDLDRESLLLKISLKDLVEEYPYIMNYFEALRIELPKEDATLMDLLNQYPKERFMDYGMKKTDFCEAIFQFIEAVNVQQENAIESIDSITVIGGQNKVGKEDNSEFTVKKGEITAIMGPTGAGKSRLLEDIECLAQGDTPTGRTILLNNSSPTDAQRFKTDKYLVAELSQNMNFVIDLTVEEFLVMHAKSRGIDNYDLIIEEIIQCANELVGEAFNESTPVTQLSGGQSRALMIADTALLSASPIVLIDEIENAGIDRRKALSLLAKKEKVILISTHDPILALMSDRRVIINKGAVQSILETSYEEKQNLDFLEAIDKQFMNLRQELRYGATLNENLQKQFNGLLN